MLPTMPPLPADTALTHFMDEYGQPCVAWGKPTLKSRCFQILGMLFIVFPLVAAPVISLRAIILQQSLRDLVVAIGSWSCMTLVWAIVFVRIGRHLWRQSQSNLPGRTRVEFSEAWLIHRPGGVSPEPPERQPHQWGRWKLTPVRLEQGEHGLRLLMDEGDRQVEIGQSLSDSDLKWLADVIKEWMTTQTNTQWQPESEGPMATGQAS